MPTIASAQNWGRGPIQVTDIFPIALGKLNYYPSSPETTEVNTLKIRTALHWGNTINGIDENYLIDAESREALISSRYGLKDNLEVGLHIPILWRGSGVFDSFIYDWHKFWGFPQGPRFESEQDRYEISGVRSDLNYFEFNESGTKLGNLRFSLKRQFTRGNKSSPAISGETILSAPTGSYSNNGFEILTSLNTSKKYQQTSLYFGAFLSASENKEYQDIDFKRFRYGLSANIEIEIQKYYSLIFGIVYGSNYTSDISRLPNYQLYADIGLKYEIRDNLELELLIRENPAPDRGSSDFSFLIALDKGISL